MTTEPITRGGETRVDPGRSVSTAVIEVVAEETGVEATALPSLYERVDPDALDAAFAPTATGRSRTGTIEFTYCGYPITIARDATTAITLGERTVE